MGVSIVVMTRDKLLFIPPTLTILGNSDPQGQKWKQKSEPKSLWWDKKNKESPGQSFKLPCFFLLSVSILATVHGKSAKVGRKKAARPKTPLVLAFWAQNVALAKRKEGKNKTWQVELPLRDVALHENGKHVLTIAWLAVSMCTKTVEDASLLGPATKDGKNVEDDV